MSVRSRDIAPCRCFLPPSGFRRTSPPHPSMPVIADVATRGRKNHPRPSIRDLLLGPVGAVPALQSGPDTPEAAKHAGRQYPNRQAVRFSLKKLRAPLASKENTSKTPGGKRSPPNQTPVTSPASGRHCRRTSAARDTRAAGSRSASGTSSPRCRGPPACTGPSGRPTCASACPPR